jgi:hypothetical protein
VAAGKGLKVSVSGGTADADYAVAARVTCTKGSDVSTRESA